MKKLCSLLILFPFLALANEGLVVPKKDWSFDGPFGTFDRAAAQRGFQVFKEVCAACHSISLIKYRDFKELGFSSAEIKAIAAAYEVEDGPNDEGKMFMRPGLPSDIFFQPYKNEQEARAVNQGALPVDLSLITKARHHGADYVYALLTGFDHTPPKDMVMFPGKHYNPYFPGGQISMPPPLIHEGLVTYADGTKATVDQMASDVTVFLAWASEPEMEKRKQIGLKMILMLGVLAIMLCILKKTIWRRMK